MAGNQTTSDRLAMEKKRALDNAMHQIEKEFGTGAIMRLGDMGAKMNLEVIPTGSLALDVAVGIGDIHGAVSLKSMARNPQGKPHWRSMPLPKHRKWAEWLLLLMRNMRWIPFMRIIWVWIPMSC